MKKVYFGHPVSYYGTITEKLLINSMMRGFPNWHIENPDQSIHDEGYKRYKLEKDDGMLYFFEEVLPLMDAGVFLPFEDGMFGAGVYAEAKFLADNGKPIYEIDYDGGLSKLVLDESRKLSVEETRKRVYLDESDGNLFIVD